MIINLLWRHRMVLGIVLVLLELAASAFLVWFGVRALIGGIVILAVPSLSFAWQALVWIICSVLFIWTWFKVFRPGFHKTRAGMPRAVGDRDTPMAGSQNIKIVLLPADMQDAPKGILGKARAA